MLQELRHICGQALESGADPSIPEAWYELSTKDILDTLLKDVISENKFSITISYMDGEEEDLLDLPLAPTSLREAKEIVDLVFEHAAYQDAKGSSLVDQAGLRESRDAKDWNIPTVDRAFLYRGLSIYCPWAEYGNQLDGYVIKDRTGREVDKGYYYRAQMIPKYFAITL